MPTDRATAALGRVQRFASMRPLDSLTVEVFFVSLLVLVALGIAVLAGLGAVRLYRGAS